MSDELKKKVQKRINELREAIDYCTIDSHHCRALKEEFELLSGLQEREARLVGLLRCVLNDSTWLADEDRNHDLMDCIEKELGLPQKNRETK